MVYGYLYKIENKITGQVYIGQTTTLNKRKLDHFNSLKNNKHKNKYLQNSFNKYGLKNFVFESIATCGSQECLDDAEEMAIKVWGGHNNKKKCYNHQSGGRTAPNHSEEIKKVISSYSKGEGNYFAKLTENDVREIKRMIKNGIDGVTIGNIFGVNKACICLIRTGKRWGHINDY